MKKIFERLCDFCCAITCLLGICMLTTDDYLSGIVFILSFCAVFEKIKKIEKFEKEISHLNFLIEDKNKQITELRDKLYKNKEN